MLSSLQLKYRTDWLANKLPFYYGWIMLPVALLTMVATSPSQTFGVSVFNPFLRQDLNLSHSQLTGAYMIGTLLASFPQPYFGRLMDRFGLRRTTLLFVILLGLACALAASASGLLTLFLAFLCLRMFGQGALSLMAMNTLPMWFQERLGAVSGMVNVGVAASVATLPRAFLWLITQIGWRPTYLLLGLAIWALMFPLLLFLFRNQPDDVGQQLDGAPALTRPPGAQGPGPALTAAADVISLPLSIVRRHYAFWIFLAAGAAWGMIATAIFFNILPIFEDLGLSAADAALSFTILASATATLHIIGGFLADRIPLRWLAAASMALLAAAVALLMRVTSTLDWQLYAVTLGAAQGLWGAVNSTVWVRYFGRLHLGAIRGAVLTASVAGSSAGPFLMGATYDLFGSYRLSLMFFLALVVPLAVAIMWARPPDPTKYQPDPATGVAG